MVAVAVIVLVILILILKKLFSSSTGNTTKASTDFGRLLMDVKSALPMPVIRQTLGFLQIDASINIAFNVELPPELEDFISSLGFLKIEIRWFFACRGWPVRFFTMWFVKSFSPFLLVFITVLVGRFVRYKDPRRTEEFMSSFLQYTLFFLVFLHPVVTVGVLELFKCAPALGAETAFLMSDVVVRCRSTEWYFYAFLGFGVLLSYSLGFPLAVAVLLRRRRTELQFWRELLQYKTTIRGKGKRQLVEEIVVSLRIPRTRSTGLVKQMLRWLWSARDRRDVLLALNLGIAQRYQHYMEARRKWKQLLFLHSDYDDRHYYWEVCEITYKVLLLAGPMLITFGAPDTELDVTLGVTLTFFFCMIGVRCWPRAKASDNMFALLCTVVTFLTLFSMVLLQGGVSFADKQIGIILLGMQVSSFVSLF